ncbi:MAG: hypothetical protein ACHQD8_05700 [Chitinophagales bacterium]
MRRFVLLVDSETTNEVSSFVEYLKKEGYGWFHRTSNSWLITTTNSTLTTEKLRDSAITFFPNRMLVVINMINGDWNGWGIKSNFDWFNESDGWG